VKGLLETFRARAAVAGGRLGAIVLDPSGREVLAIDADELMPAASVIKLPLVMTLFADAAAGRLSLDERMPVGDRVDGSGVLRDLADLDAMSLRDLAALTMTVSDNTAANRLIERVGPDRVNERLGAWGCPKTRLRRAMFDLDAKARGLENVMTARETASLLRRIADGARDGDDASVSVLGLLERNTDRTRLGRYLPTDVTLAHKDGWMDEVDNDAGIVRARSGVVVVGFTNGIDPRESRPLLGLLGLAAASLAGAEVGKLPREAGG
jgi:beta-lactamase class A